MAERGVPVECAGCGLRWEVLPKPDGTMPTSSRCPRYRGGCGKLRKVPRGAAAPVAGAATPGAWNPPGDPRADREDGEKCRECGHGTLVDSRGITHWCPACVALVTPAGVLAPYERGTGVTRAARSQRERDDDAKATAVAAGEFLRRVRALLADSRIHPASADLLGWYEEEITEARKGREGRRLAELADEFAADAAGGKFRRLHFWQGRPVAITAGTVADDDGQDYDDEDHDEPPALLVTPVAGTASRTQLRRATWADALAARGLRLVSAPPNVICQIAGPGGRCANPTGGNPPVSDGLTDAHVCEGHYNQLGGTISAINRTRGITT